MLLISFSSAIVSLKLVLGCSFCTGLLCWTAICLPDASLVILETISSLLNSFFSAKAFCFTGETEADKNGLVESDCFLEFLIVATGASFAFSTCDFRGPTILEAARALSWQLFLKFQNLTENFCKSSKERKTNYCLSFL